MCKSLRTAAAALILTALLAAPAQAACTQEEANQKIVALMQAMHELSQKDPEKFETLRKEFDQEMQHLEAQNEDDELRALCTFADKALRRVKE